MNVSAEFKEMMDEQALDIMANPVVERGGLSYTDPFSGLRGYGSTARHVS